MSSTRGSGNTSNQPEMGRRNRNNLIPEGWQGCPSMGTGFVDDSFAVFKTPLKSELNNRMPPSERFSIENVFERVYQMNGSHIGLWIDLTNTSRYYNPAEIQSRGVEYIKLSCEGHGKPPSKRSITGFCNIVQHFFKRNRRDYVGVHYIPLLKLYLSLRNLDNLGFIVNRMLTTCTYTMSFPLERPVQVSDPEWLTRRMIMGNDATASSSSHAVQASSSFAASTNTSSDTEYKESHQHQQHIPSALLPPFPVPSTYDVPMPTASTFQQGGFVPMVRSQHQHTPFS